MFKPASLHQQAAYPLPGEPAIETLDYFMEEQHEIGLRVTSDGALTFFNTGNGSLVKQLQPLKEASGEVSAYVAGDPSQYLLAFATRAGQVLLIKHRNNFV